MLFKPAFAVLALAGLAAADVAAPAKEARSVDAGNARMVKIKRAQDSILADQDVAKRSATPVTDSAKLVRRAAKGAHRADKRHHGDVAHEKRKVEEKPVEKRDLNERDLPLFQGLTSLLNKLYPGLNTAVLGTEFTLTGATNGLDDVLRKRGVEERDLPLFLGLQSLLNKLYPGLNTAVLGTEFTLTGATDGLDDVLRKRGVEERDLPLFQGLTSLLNKLYPGLNTAVLGTEFTLTGATDGLDDVLKKRDATAAPVNEKRDLPLFLGLQSLLNKLYPGLNTAVLGVEGTLTGATSGLDDVLKRDLNERDLPLFQGLTSLLNKLYPGLNTAVLGVEGTLTGATNGLDDVLKKRSAITANVQADLVSVIDSLLGGTAFSTLSTTQIGTLTNVLGQASSASQLNNLLGSSFSGTQFSQLNTIVSNGLLGGLLGGNGLLGGLLGGNGLLGGLLGGSTSSGNLLGGLLGGLTSGAGTGNLLGGLQGLSLKE